MARGGESLFQIVARGQDGETRLDAKTRTSPTRKRVSVDPTQAYIENSKRGMTDQEIRWMLEDFKQVAMLPDSGLVEGSRTFMARQSEWYLTALTEALSLTPEQKRTARESLRGSLDREAEKFEAEVDAAVARGEGLDWNILNPYLEANHWIRRPEFAPWNLCGLTENQSRLTIERQWLEREKGAMEVRNLFSSRAIWLNFFSIAMQDPASGESIRYPPASVWDSACHGGAMIKGIINISEAFPLTPDQELAEHRNDLVTQARMLQPAQLRMALLLNSDLSSMIRHQLVSPTMLQEPDGK